MPVKITPTIKGVTVARNFTQRVPKALRHQLCDANRKILKRTFQFDTAGAVLTAHRDIEHATELLAGLRIELTAVGAALDTLEGKDIGPVGGPLVQQAETLKRTADAAKEIDANAGICDLDDVIDALHQTQDAMRNDVQIAQSNLAHCRIEFKRLLVGCFAQKGCDINFIGARLFDSCEKAMIEALPAEIGDDLRDLGFTFIRRHWEYGTVTKDPFETDEDNISANYVAAACERYLDGIRRKHAASKARRATERAKAAEAQEQQGRDDLRRAAQ